MVLACRVNISGWRESDFGTGQLLQNLTIHYINSTQKFNTHYCSCSFKELLHTVTESKDSCISFMQKNGVLMQSIKCPGVLIHGRRQGGCNNQMVLKKTADSKDGLVWQCRKLHKVQKDD